MRVATWNVLNGTSLDDGQVDAGRLRAVAAGLDVDLLALQEVDRGQPRSHRLDLTAVVADGAAHRFVPALVGTPGGTWRPADGDALGEPEYGVGLVSRYPVRSWHVLRLAPARVTAPVLLPGTRSVLWLKDEPRVAVAAVVDAPDGPLTVAATHLSFVPGWNAVQLRRLSRWLRALPAPRLLLGDLNLPARAAGAASGMQVLARARTFPAPAPRVQLDHVLGTGLGPVRDVQTPSVPVSDHRPLVVEL